LVLRLVASHGYVLWIIAQTVVSRLRIYRRTRDEQLLFSPSAACWIGGLWPSGTLIDKPGIIAVIKTQSPRRI